MEIKGHITSFFYNLDRKAVALIKVEQENGLENYLALKRNKNLEIKKDYGKFCVGYYNNGSFHPCPEKKEIKRGRKCYECYRKDDYLKCARCNGSFCNANSNIRKTCFEKTHFLYITLIGNKIKVGVTRAGRYLKRWIEQGSDYSSLIGSGTGLEVRRKEHELSKVITDRVTTKQKIKLFMKDNKEILKDFLKKNNIDAQIINVRKYYTGLDCIPKKPCVYDGLLNGRIVCVKGKILIFEKENEYYYYNINDLIAHKVKLNYT